MCLLWLLCIFSATTPIQEAEQLPLKPQLLVQLLSFCLAAVRGNG